MEASKQYCQSPANKIFSINLILEEIFVNLDPPDLLTLTRVNKKFCQVGRKVLRKHKFCVVRLGTNPCVALKSLDTFLESSSTLPFYNGIEVKPECPRSRKITYGACGHTSDSCNKECLSSTDFAEGNATGKSVHELYSNILKKLEFKVFRFEGNLDPGCPFGKLIRIILSEKADELVELQLCGLFLNLQDYNIHPSIHYVLSLWEYLAIPETRKLNWFPKLRTYDGCTFHKFDTELALASPNLAIMRHAVSKYMFNSDYDPDCRDPDLRDAFPALVKSKQCTITNINFWLLTEDIEYLATQAQPKLVKCKICWPIRHSEEDFLRLERSMTMLGNVIQFTLEDLTCPIFILALLANSRSTLRFHNLRRLELVPHSNYTHQFPLLKSVDFPKKFPNLQSVVSIGNDPDVGQISYSKAFYEVLENTGMSLSVKDLSLFAEPNDHTLNVLSNVFPNVTNLDVSFHTYAIPQTPNIFLRHNVTKWPLIQHLNLKVPGKIFYGKSNLDCWFLDGKSSSLEESSSSDAIRMESHGTNENSFPSLFHIQNLKSIALGLCCTEEKCVLLPGTHRSEVEVSPFLVSRKVAKVICEKFPGLIAEVSVNSNRNCNYSDHQTFELNHLVSYARVVTARKEFFNWEGTERTKLKIEFLCNQ